MENFQQKVLIVSGAKGDTRRYRTIHLYQQFCLAGADCSLAHLTDPRLAAQAKQAGLLVLHRVPCDRYVEGIIEGVQACGGLVLVDTDDLIFDPQAFQWIGSPDFSDPVRARLYQENMHRFRRTLEKSDAALASTAYLAENVRRLGKPCQVHRNAFSLELNDLSQAAYTSRCPDASRVVIGYASGTLTHNQDLALVRPTLIEALERFPQAELWLLGALDGGEWGSVSRRVRRMPLVAWQQLPARLAQFDINLAPLVMDNPFAQSKSEIKYMEAGLVGVPTIASPTEAFRFAIRPGENGLLAENLADWKVQLESLITDPQRRQALGEAARRQILEAYGPLKRIEELRQALASIGQQTGHPGLELVLGRAPVRLDTPPNYDLPPDLEQHPTLLEMGLYYLRRGEVLRLFGMIWVQVRRLLAPVFPFQ